MNTSTTPQRRVLVVDDEADIRELLEITLARIGLESFAVGSLEAAREALAGQHFDLCLTDMRLPDGSGMTLVSEINARPEAACPVAVVTAYGDMHSAVEALKAGAFDFVAKPLSVERLRTLIDHALRIEPSQNTAPMPAKNGESPQLLGNSPPMAELRDMIVKVGRSQAPIYVSGESGSGKELVARGIHHHSTRAGRAFVPVNCGAIPAELIESELFGYVAGAFTGAGSDTPGLFASADGGTLFLDEVAELGLATQVKLLRAVQERSIRPVGGNREIPVDIRVISATHKNLAREVTAGRFRQDLFYRLNVIELDVPPLRKRRSDLAGLIDHILRRLATQNALAHTPQLDSLALDALLQYDFPGNVRELENILERAVTLTERDTIRADDLRLGSAAPNNDDAPDSNRATNTVSSTGNGHALNLEEELEALERQRIEQALQACRFNKTRAAQHLGISFRALRYRLAKLEME